MATVSSDRVCLCDTVSQIWMVRSRAVSRPRVICVTGTAREDSVIMRCRERRERFEMRAGCVTVWAMLLLL